MYTHPPSTTDHERTHRHRIPDPSIVPASTVRGSRTAIIHLDEIQSWAATYELVHLFSPEFNVQATRADDNDRMTRMRMNKKNLLSKQVTGGIKKEEDASSSSSSPRPPKTPAPASPAPKHRLTNDELSGSEMKTPTSVGDGSSLAAPIDLSGPPRFLTALTMMTFADPAAADGSVDGPESRQDRVNRMSMWSMFQRTLVHHKHLLSGINYGNLHALMKRVRDFCLGSGLSAAVRDVIELLSMRRKRESWNSFVARFQPVWTRVATCVEPGRRIGVELVCFVLLRAAEVDVRLAVEVRLIRRGGHTDVQDILTRLSNIDGGDIVPSEAPPLALYTDVPTDRARAPRRSAPCYSFLGGRCTKGDKCSFSHESKDASGVPQCAFCKGYGHVKDKCNKYRNSRDKAAVDAQANLAAAEPPKEAAAAPSVVGLLSAAPRCPVYGRDDALEYMLDDRTSN